MTDLVSGYCDSKFSEVRELFFENLKSGADLGASFAVTMNGEMVIDLWGGYLDESRSSLWQADTLVNVYSTTKTMTFLCALVLADRGLLNLDANVADYWPEFAQNGKESIKVWHVLDHASGVSGFDQPLIPEDLYNWGKITGLLAAQAPWWKPGSATGYHALTQGYLIGEIVRRITGKTIGAFFRDEIAKPLNADFLIGVPQQEFHRIGNLVPVANASPAGRMPKDSIATRTFINPIVPAVRSHTDAWRRAEIPAANGHGNARSVVRAQTILACKGSAFGVSLLSRQTAESVMVERISGIDLVLGQPMRFGLGYALMSADVPLSPNKNACYWGGWGGSSILVDQDAAISASYVMNKMSSGIAGDMRSFNLMQAMYRAL